MSTLSDREQIETLKYRYVRALDTKDWDAFGDTLTEDVTAGYGDRLTFSGRAAVLSFMTENLGSDVITVHNVHHPELHVDGDSATGTWSLEDTVIAVPYKLLLRGAAIYTDRYRRCEGGAWRICATGYRRIYESTLSLDDLPSFTLTSR
ncbi:nuclear transport factor 2 family protein [Spongisporangium articulatum]|uniref:Nuclear transport factor 2 family protein n=1 Tax=Spongisporangium articulatum TaxID=3362603 RepID=A0ABW8ATU3_9ACTN